MKQQQKPVESLSDWSQQLDRRQRKPGVSLKITSEQHPNEY